jgi:hypothetical protein
LNNLAFRNKKAQALVELAMFGTVLLFCLTLLLRYGMNAAQQQNMTMQSFRKAFVRASSSNSGRSGNINPGWDYENSNPPLPSNHWRNVGYTVIEDKPIFSASGVLPIVERVPMGASVDALRSIDMFGQMEYGDNRDLPRVEYEINDRRYSFTIAAYRSYTQHSDMRIKEDIPNWNGQGTAWRWKTVSSVNAGDSVDVDGDGYEEYVMEKSEETLKCIDYQEGEINLSEKIADSGREKGGVQPDYSKEALVNNSTFTRKEDASGITTTDRINAQEIFSRTIKTRAGDYDVVDDLSTQKTKTWYTPNK